MCVYVQYMGDLQVYLKVKINSRSVSIIHLFPLFMPPLLQKRIKALETQKMKKKKERRLSFLWTPGGLSLDLHNPMRPTWAAL